MGTLAAFAGFDGGSPPLSYERPLTLFTGATDALGSAVTRRTVPPGFEDTFKGPGWPRLNVLISGPDPLELLVRRALGLPESIPFPSPK